MAKMKPEDLQAMLAAEKNDALAAVSSTKLSADRANALDYYIGDMEKDMPSIEGRSRAVSMDVSDTVEGLMPSLMEIFCSSEDVVRFDPVGPEDVQGAEQETDYVNHVFMQKNPGFLVLYSFIKDALLSKVGVVKVWWEETEKEERDTYYDIPDDAYAVLIGDPDIEVAEHSEKDGPPDPTNPDAPPAKLHDVTVVQRKSYGCAKVEPVPPEEFGVARRTKRIADADYCFHEVIKSESELIELGYDPEQVKQLPSYTFPSHASVENFARDTVNENTQATGDEGLNEAIRKIQVTEHYVKMDYEGDGKARLYRVTTGGTQSEILKRDGKEEIVPEDMVRFAAMTPVIITHRFFGRSIADLVMDIQRIKTALLRALLDNAYLANNPRTEVSESHTTDSTLDDLLVSRPGGIVRTKQPGGLNVFAHPDISAGIFPLLEYQDAQREWRTGVSKQGAGLDANALQNQTATAANQLYTAAQARMKLIARIFAETGIRDLFYLLHGVIRKHGSKPETVRLRNQWVTVDPRNWKARNDMTVQVGLGSGSKAERLAHLMAVIGMQKDAMVNGLTNLVTPDNLYNSAKELVKLVDLKQVEPYFTDPKNAPPPQQKPDPKLIEIQAKAQAEGQKVQADAAHQQMKTQAEISLEERKFEFQSKLMLLQHELKVKEHHMTMATKAVDAASTGAADGGGGNAFAPIMHMMVDHLQRANAPKRVRKLDDGSWVSEPAPTANGVV